jgi:predicted nuclease of predicted toxin-antitoxin system
MRLLVDAHVSPKVAQALREQGHDAVAATEVGLATAEDRDLWQVAIAQDRVVLSYNSRDFAPLYQEFWLAGTEYPGLILVSTRSLPPDDIGGLIRALTRFAQRDEPLRNRMVFLERPSEGAGEDASAE